MIRTETLFVLGAGASHPFGFPTGEGLKAQLCELLARGHSSPAKESLKDLKWTELQIEEFAQEFLYSGLKSIDSFLATREKYHDLGLQAIAATLMPQERAKQLYVTRSDPPVWGNSDWMGYLWDSIRDGATRPETITENRIRFITFNYDRSLEMFLLNAIKHTFGITADEANEYRAMLPIHHVYGSFGDFEEGIGYRYGDAITPEMIRAAAKRLLVVPAQRQDVDSKCVELIEDARRVFFLGFGYDEANCHRIGFQATRQRTGAGGAVLGTCLGMTTSESRRCADRISTGNSRPVLSNVTSLALLREASEHLA